jgi:hypothetical protein
LPNEAMLAPLVYADGEPDSSQFDVVVSHVPAPSRFQLYVLCAFPDDVNAKPTAAAAKILRRKERGRSNETTFREIERDIKHLNTDRWKINQ